MLSAISAEALKLRRHRATWLLVWIFPILVLVGFTIAIIAQMVQNSPPPTRAVELSRWLDNASDFWDATSSGLVRMLAGAFIAVVFAGEYGWNTWKLIVPHRSRTTLIAAKYVVSLALLYAAFLAAALLWTGMDWLRNVVAGNPIPEGVTLGALAQAHWGGFLGGLPTVLFTVALVSFFAILTRSTVAALVIGIVVVTLEQLFRAFGPILSMYMPGFIDILYQVLPGYHLANLSEWATRGRAEQVPFPSGEVVAYDWPVSLAIVAAWTIAFVALTFLRFRRQDIN
jgi:ABC-type transport system involved in multi-copper enzyme maturation permease subunit